MNGLTHASFFSGVGGLDMGLERAGWRTVSFSEIDPYASAVLAQRWPGVPNLGNIVSVAGAEEPVSHGLHVADSRGGNGHERQQHSDPWSDATLWSGGFPCQDLSVAGKRRGLAGERSGLAFAFLALVERHRPPAVLVENVPGLLSSHAGRDFGTLLGSLGELGYGWAYRVLDARHFGVPQRRRRVFILALHAGVDPSGQGAAEVLSVGTRCDRHLAAGVEAGTNAADGLGAGFSRSLSTSNQHIDADVESFIVRPSPDSRRDGAADGLAGRLDDRGAVVHENQRGEISTSDIAYQLVGGGGKPGQGYPAVLGATGSVTDDALLPLGLDSHRYRCCGNGVVSSVSEYIGLRLAAWFA